MNDTVPISLESEKETKDSQQKIFYNDKLPLRRSVHTAVVTESNATI